MTTNRRCQPLGFIVIWAAFVVAALLSPSLFPSHDPADMATRQTARVAVFFWGLAAAMLLLRRRAIARWLWTLGCAAYLVHVATAFDQVHHWSHQAAYEHVDSVSGFGPGIFVSYGFTILWMADVAWWWASPHHYDRRPRWFDWSIHGFMAFVVFNGTVVYETGFIRWGGAVMFAFLGVLIVCRKRDMSGGSEPQA